MDKETEQIQQEARVALNDLVWEVEDKEGTSYVSGRVAQAIIDSVPEGYLHQIGRDLQKQAGTLDPPGMLS